jgi:uncharacterized protein (TIGR02611 family)
MWSVPRLAGTLASVRGSADEGGRPGAGRGHTTNTDNQDKDVKPGRRARLRRRMRRNPATRLVWRSGVLVIGGVVSIAGLIMMVTPGPGWVGLITGLLILSLEFDWAERWLHRARLAARRAQTQALDPRRLGLNLALGSVSLVVGAAVTWWWFDRHGVPAPVASVYDALASLF